MLAEERCDRIVALVNEKKSVTVQELMDMLGASESTIRRDLSLLDSRGEIVKVYGGAVAVTVKQHDDDVRERRILFPEEKKLIAKYAASLVKRDDFVYIDAGTTTEYIIDFLTETGAVYVTNAASHAKKLSRNGFCVYLAGGRLKRSTEAVIGSTAADFIMRYNFTIGFWGANGIHRTIGFTTPDPEEADIKQVSMSRCKRRFIVADSSKFGVISPVTFSEFKNAAVITDKKDGIYSECANIISAH
ncbi:MAG TPA: DeoR/GlpR transcriptional regulator [Candidatus Ornithomonoglobus merdipullorum]|uniref:DeoR/GlpR transcriptional regulator n=1 Tax=Candidatus Ornithomonoglobus merdipullorum TaxID=2840895 RepID=A0A9D1SEM1_9FIRM|nr:DeoR/GlpR transcriptional regulator [Candidatus Ornithomonoglobus merdipullorum]